MTAGTCSATVTVVGIGTFTCVQEADHEGAHQAELPTEGQWAAAIWSGPSTTIAPPGSRRGRP